MNRLLSILISFLIWTNTAQSQVTEVEVFFNNDPGFGKGFLLRVEPGEVVSTIAELAAQSLEPGHHKAFIRVREKNTWSHSAFVGVVQVADDKIPLLSSGDHFFNVYVPGPQVHTHPFEATGQLDRQFSISARGLPAGRNQLFFRVSDGKRKSHLVPLSFIVYQPESSFTAGEFFVNTDPGQNNATQTPIEVSDLVVKTLDLKPGELNFGRNTVYFRLKNQKVWSHYAALPLGVSHDPNTLPPLATARFQISERREKSDWVIQSLDDLTAELDDILEIPTEKLTIGDYTLLMKVSDRAGRESHYADLMFSVCESINPIIKADGNLLSVLADREPDSYQWLFNGDTMPGEIKPQIIITEPGEYRVIVYYDDCFDISPPWFTDDEPTVSIVLSPIFRFNTLPRESIVLLSQKFLFNTLTDKPEQFIVLSPLFGFDTRVWDQFIVLYRSFFFNTLRTPVVAAIPLSSLILFPNPATEFINIRSDVMVNQLQVFDIAGRMILEIRISGYDFTIPVNEFESGMYFFKMETSHGWETRKMVIKN